MKKLVPEPQNVQAFIAEMRQKLSRFQSYWYAQNRHNPDSFPLAMWPGDWDEQFDIFEREEFNDEGE